MDRQKQKLGCNRPGESYGEGTQIFTFSSPSLQGDGDRQMRECPVGYTLRRAPHIYDLMDLCSVGENATPSELARMPRYYQHALRLYRSEMARMRETEMRQSQSRSDSDFATAVLRERSRG